jgi:hypothetical protein
MGPTRPETSVKDYHSTPRNTSEERGSQHVTLLTSVKTLLSIKTKESEICSSSIHAEVTSRRQSMLAKSTVRPPARPSIYLSLRLDTPFLHASILPSVHPSTHPCARTSIHPPNRLKFNSQKPRKCCAKSALHTTLPTVLSRPFTRHYLLC